MSAWPSPPPMRILDGKKTVIPLENNPETLTLLASLLSLRRLSFYDILSFSPLYPQIPRPAHALLFLTSGAVIDRVRAEDKHIFGPEPASSDPFPLAGPDRPVTWFKQTIGHACGTMALIHALANGKGRAAVPRESPLFEIFERAGDLEVEDRARLLYDNEELIELHMAAAAEGDTRPIDPAGHVAYGFVAFVKTEDGRYWEFDGAWTGPFERGRLEDGEDVLSERAIDLGPGRYLKAAEELDQSDISCVALVLEDH